jgi:hypothetical protein
LRFVFDPRKWLAGSSEFARVRKNRIALYGRLEDNRARRRKAAMLAKVCSAAVNGIEAYPVEVEVNAGLGETVIVLFATVHPQEKLTISAVFA